MQKYSFTTSTISSQGSSYKVSPFFLVIQTYHCRSFTEIKLNLPTDICLVHFECLKTTV